MVGLTEAIQHWTLFGGLKTENVESIIATYTAIGAFAQIVLALSIPLTLISLAVAYANDRKLRRDNFYAQLDRMYQDIIQLAIAHPSVRLINITRTPSEQVVYNSYAYLTWNFLESIYDYCMEDEHLRNTWTPVFHTEGAAYGEWFNQRDNRLNFKKSFCRFIDEKGYAKQTSISSGLLVDAHFDPPTPARRRKRS